MREYTAASVFDGIRAGADWAEPVMDPTGIDWPARQAAAAIPFQVVDGRPVIPGPSTGITHGRNELGHWGELQCADAVVIAVDRPMTRRRVRRVSRWVLLIERGDGHGWAIPGGTLDRGETALQAAVRELREETGLVLPAARWTCLPAVLVPDPRASDEAWMVTTPAVAQLHVDDPDDLPAVLGADDARRAIWCPADTYRGLTAHLQQTYSGQVFAAHQDLLAEILSTAGDAVRTADQPVTFARRGLTGGHIDAIRYTGRNATTVAAAFGARPTRRWTGRLDVTFDDDTVIPLPKGWWLARRHLDGEYLVIAPAALTTGYTPAHE